MATENVIQHAHQATPQVDYITSAVRLRLAMEAAGEMEAAAGIMLRELVDADQETIGLRALALRNRQLASVIMSALSDDNDTEEAITARLRGFKV